MTNSPLFDIPVELWLEICWFISLRDMTSIFQTCKRLHALSKERKFWIHHLRRVLHRFHVPFDIPVMSTDELRKAVTRPYRFQRIVVKQRFDTRTPTQLKLPIYAEDAILIPGGHWLVLYGQLEPERFSVSSSTTAGTCYLQIWDIKTPAARNLSLVTSMRLKSSPLKLYIRPSRSESEGVALLYLCPKPSEVQLEVEVYSFDPLKEEQTRLTLMEAVKVPCSPLITGEPRLVFVGDWMILSMKTLYFIVVDWRNRQWNFVRMPSEVSPAGFRRVFFNTTCYDKWMVALHANARDVSIFRRPSMNPWPIPDPDLITAETLQTAHPTMTQEEGSPLCVCPTDLLPPERIFYQSWSIPRTTLWDEESPQKVFCSGSKRYSIWVADSSRITDGTDQMQINLRFYEAWSLPPSSPIGQPWLPIRLTFSETVDGEAFALETYGSILYFNREEGPTGLYTPQQLFRNISERNKSCHHPFVCPVSGTIGAIGSDGNLFIYQEK